MSRLRFFALVGVLAVLATACWRPADLDGPGVPGGNGRTGDALDTSAIATVGIPSGVGVVANVDPVTHRLRLGIDGIITDRPDRARTLLEERGMRWR